MDCSKTLFDPPTGMSLLYQQTQEQSAFCDVTIKVGLWEKRFHSCVLAASPFFEAIHRNNFIEKQTRIIELNKWPASLVEHSLLFLYGSKPKVTDANVDKLLDIAEFLFIPELKIACIDFLNRTKVTVDNCMQLLELSCVYGFELGTCENFIRGYLPKILEQEGMLNATTESVKLLLEDPTLSYVPVQKWFNFIIRWTQRACERQCNFVELFRMLDFGEHDSDFINNIVAKEPLVMENKDVLEKTLAACVDGHMDTVVIFKTNDCKSLTCLNLRTMLWYKTDIATDSDNKDISRFWQSPVSGVNNSISSSIYKANRTYNSFSVLTHDLSNAESSVSNVFIGGTDDDDARRYNFSCHSFSNDTLVAMSNESRTILTRAGKSGKANAVASFEKYYQTISTLYIGRLVGSDWKMNAIMSIRNHSMSKICCGDNGSIAMLSSNDNNLFIYSEPTGELECIELKTSFRHEQTRLAGFINGFVLYGRCSVMCLTRLSGASLTIKYLVEQRTWDEPNLYQYTFDGDRWFRLKYGEASLGFVGHDDLTITEDTSLLPWRNIPLPSEHHRIDFRDIFSVSVPKGIRRCHLDCPHCEMLTKQLRRFRDIMRNRCRLANQNYI